MKLLTQAGLLYNAVHSQTVDGHYGNFPEIDWMATWSEAAQQTTHSQSIGLNPVVTGIRTTYDGGKVMGGFGMFSGTVTSAWMMKAFGNYKCNAGTAAIAQPTGYVTFAVSGGTSVLLCASKSVWLWTQANSVSSSSMITDIAEEWKSGTIIATAAAGDSPMYYAVGGINAHSSFGLGVWNFMVWMVDENGAAMTAGLYSSSAGWVGMAPAGQSSDEAALVVAPLTNSGLIALSKANSSNCFTSVMQDTRAWTTYTSPYVLVGGFSASVTTCHDYAVEEMSVSGVPFITRFA